ncbi:MAG: type II secretion system protein [Candidatus Accumulibacter sp.]|uniref:type II secretion system protein n=1 Tax=Accumulibacter sp. TaxID=2053492 RepID=UPI001A5D6659|nr:type II secretion system protein [Accumulibacter sp.]MBL8408869.1 type II secretion system protein [Accumulibacter sp.]
MPPAHCLSERRLQTGFTYLGLMILVAVLALATSATLTLGSLVQRREAEQRLLEVGDAYRRAISSYLNSSPAGDRRYPGSLADLLKDPRYPGVRRHLRQLYPDPITGKNDWGLVPAPGGGIMGIHSLSDDHPIKIAGFETANQAFEEKSRYSQWRFVVMPIATGVRTGPGQGANTPLPIANPLVPPQISGPFPSPNPVVFPAQPGPSR